MNEIVETMALLEHAEREQMIKFDEETMPKEINPAKREVGVLSVRWMVEKRMDENEETVEEEAIRDGKRRSLILFTELHLDPNYYSWTVRQDKPVARKLRCFKCFDRRMNGLTQKNNGKRGKSSPVESQLRGKRGVPRPGTKHKYEPLRTGIWERKGEQRIGGTET